MRAWLLVIIGALQALPTAVPADPPPLRVRVLTYNIHHGEGTDGRFDLPRLAAIITSAAPDLVALQEVDEGTGRAGGVHQMAELARLTGLRGVFGPAMSFQGGEYGVGVLSRWPVVSSRNTPLPQVPDREPRTALTVRVRRSPRDPVLAFTSTHLDSGREVEGRNTQAMALTELVSADAGVLAILAGDFNSRPDSDVLTILGAHWTDVSSTEPLDVDASGRPRFRVDYVFVRSPLRWRIVDAGAIDAPVASDHRPVLAVLELLPSPAPR